MLTASCYLPEQLGVAELHSPVVDVPSPVHTTASVLDSAKPLEHENSQELPWLFPSVHVGAFPLVRMLELPAGWQVIAENGQ